jgi:beta-phosphoglucomutase-like phosphatase (HAD superfamily)
LSWGRPVDLSLTVEDYYGVYLGMDERRCAALLLTARDGTGDHALVENITARKTELFRTYTIRQRPALFPGVVDFVKAGRDRYRMAIASGGRSRQIHEALEAGMNVLAVSSTYPPEKLHEADGILGSFDGTSPEAAIGLLAKNG